MLAFRHLKRASLLFLSSSAFAADTPPEIVRHLPDGFEVLSTATASVDSTHQFYVVALASVDEARSLGLASPAPTRPLLIYVRRNQEPYRLIARNDHVLLRADQGGINGCDPFEERQIAIMRGYFTVEHAVACGNSHWTEVVTFRFDRSINGFVFDNRRFQSWSFNSRTAEEALVPDEVSVERANGSLQPFASWRRQVASAENVQTSIRLEGMEYLQARRIVLGYGWEPLPGDCRGGGTSDEICAQFPEIGNCSGVGVGFCDMTFVRRDRCLRLVTIGGAPDGSPGDTTVRDVRFARAPCPKDPND